MDRPAVLLLASLFLSAAACSRHEPVSDLRLAAPTALATQARPLKNLYVNPAAVAAFREQGIPFDHMTTSSIAAASDSSAWRKFDRKERFDGVLLAGPLNEFHKLLEHLVDSPDFRLVHVDNWGLLFTRTRSTPYAPPPPEKIVASSPETRADILSQTALYLDAAKMPREARAYMNAALQASPDNALVLARSATLDLAHDQPAQAMQTADAALQKNPRQLAALEIKARALLAMGARDAAWEAAEQLKSLAPSGDMNVLFFHARLANSAGAYTREQDSLERLIQLGEKQGLPVADYRVYLGQCFARQGLARPALEQFEKAEKEPGLTSQQKNDIQTAIHTLHERAGTLAR